MYGRISERERDTHYERKKERETQREREREREREKERMRTVVQKPRNTSKTNLCNSRNIWTLFVC